ncbi:MAG: acyltransferase, partial [Actinomycetota bacterium]
MAARPDPPARAPTGGLSRVPYLPGLDGLRAIAVVGVMIYHANHRWMPGGFLGVEVFFVISGYLITMLLMGEHEREGYVHLGQFWRRRFRRLLPALYLMMALVALYICAFYTVVREQARGDFVAGIFYVSNWYQIFVGQGYAASEAFVPLRHLWSLAVEEQFYLIWPVVMVLVLRRARGRLPKVGAQLMLLSLGITVVMGLVFAGGFVPLSCSAENSNGYWHIFGRCISVNDTLYLSSITRAGGLMLGAGFAMLWRPAAIMRGPLRHKHRLLDLVALVGMVGLLLLMYFMYLFEDGYYNPWLFRGGFFLGGALTLLIIAAATHRSAATGKLLGNPLFLWIGTRSYGLYLFHWPIYEIIRKQAQIPLTVPKFILAMIITVPITEASYRFIETPIRKGQWRTKVQRLRADPRKLVPATTFVALVGVSAISMAM